MAGQGQGQVKVKVGSGQGQVKVGSRRQAQGQKVGKQSGLVQNNNRVEFRGQDAMVRKTARSVVP